MSRLPIEKGPLAALAGIEEPKVYRQQLSAGSLIGVAGFFVVVGIISQSCMSDAANIDAELE